MRLVGIQVPNAHLMQASHAASAVAFKLDVSKASTRARHPPYTPTPITDASPLAPDPLSRSLSLLSPLVVCVLCFLCVCACWVFWYHYLPRLPTVPFWRVGRTIRGSPRLSPFSSPSAVCVPTVWRLASIMAI